MSERMTCVFEFDVRSYDGNPFHAETPFGKPIVLNDGDLAAEFDEAEARAETAERLLRRALPFIDDAEDAHSVFSESVLTDECKELVIEIRDFLSRGRKP